MRLEYRCVQVTGLVNVRVPKGWWLAGDTE